jgi:RNA polymerase sigma factor (sigma-70 family)
VLVRTPVVTEIAGTLEGSWPDRRIGCTPAVRRAETLDVVALALAARAGDERAWEELRRRLSPRLRRVIRRFRLSAHDADEVEQNTFLRLLEHGSTIREPAALPWWLDTTARRECLRLLQRNLRETPLDRVQIDGEAPSSEDVVLARDLRAVLGTAIGRLPDRQRELLELLLDDPDRSYRYLSARLGVPIGSIGPTLMRAMARLRRDPEIARLAPTR